jgi:AraC-like DNA-binding protein
VGTGRAVYIGPSLQLTTHSGAVACLALGLDGPLRVHVGPGGYVRARSVLVPARLPHHVVAEGGRTAFCYLDPAGHRLRSCRFEMRAARHGVHLSHRYESDLLELARSGHAAALLQAAAPVDPQPRVVDPRVDRAVRRLNSPAGVALPAAELAGELGLSTSRFLHLFGEHTQTTLRRYRSWCRMLLAARTLAAGADLTRAAADAGFATPSHFSAAFRRMFGLTPGRLLATAGRPVVWNG